MKIMRTLLLFLLLGISQAYALPMGFVYLHDIDPTIAQDIRYASPHNFIGRPINGYEASTCILTTQAALALSKIQTLLRPHHLSLKVYDCYRPTRAVADFMVWSQDPSAQQMKAEFYPRINKAHIFRLEYVAAKSGHSRGSTMDLTIEPLPVQPELAYDAHKPLVACFAPKEKRYPDHSLDMGTGFDCLDPSAEVFHPGLTNVAQEHQQLLRHYMLENGFVPYAKEWWHFTLDHEPYPDTYFDFTVSGS